MSYSSRTWSFGALLPVLGSRSGTDPFLTSSSTASRSGSLHYLVLNQPYACYWIVTCLTDDDSHAEWQSLSSCSSGSLLLLTDSYRL